MYEDYYVLEMINSWASVKWVSLAALPRTQGQKEKKAISVRDFVLFTRELVNVSFCITVQVLGDQKSKFVKCMSSHYVSRLGSHFYGFRKGRNSLHLFPNCFQATTSSHSRTYRN